MSSFLEQLRARAKENQNATQPPVPAAGTRDESQPGTGTAAVGEAALGVESALGAETQTSGIEGTESKPAEAPAPQAKATGLSFLAGLNRRVAATAPTDISSDSSALSGELSRGTDESSLSGGDEDDSLGEAGPDSSGRGDAPINAATIVESGDSTALAVPDSTLSAAELFKLRLASLAALCETESGITPLVHDTVKAHVAGIMTDLRDNPEMRGLLLDGDMHNIMAFVQSSTTIQQTKIEKTDKKRATASKKAITSSAFSAGFDMLDAVPTLSGTAALNTDNIETKVR